MLNINFGNYVKMILVQNKFLKHINALIKKMNY